MLSPNSRVWPQRVNPTCRKVGGGEDDTFQNHADVLLKNNGATEFTFTAAWTQGKGAVLNAGQPRPTRGVTAADFDEDGDLDNYDDDGDLDLLTNGGLFQNQAVPNPAPSPTGSSPLPENLNGGSHYLNVRVGSGQLRGTTVGTQVRITLGEEVLTRQVEIGVGAGNQNDPTLHFGLGDHDGPLEIEVQWPDGTIQNLTALGDQTIVVYKLPGDINANYLATFSGLRPNEFASLDADMDKDRNLDSFFAGVLYNGAHSGLGFVHPGGAAGHRWRYGFLRGSQQYRGAANALFTDVSVRPFTVGE